MCDNSSALAWEARPALNHRRWPGYKSVCGQAGGQVWASIPEPTDWPEKKQKLSSEEGLVTTGVSVADVHCVQYTSWPPQPRPGGGTRAVSRNPAGPRVGTAGTPAGAAWGVRPPKYLL